MRIGIMFSCQHRMLADVLRHARPGCEVVSYDVASLGDPAVQGPVAADLVACDHVLSIYTAEAMGPLALAALRARAPALTELPSFSFGGFHPDTVYVPTARGFLDGPTHHYHSRIAIGGYLAGFAPRQTAGLYNALVFGRLGYFQAFLHERIMACQLFAQFDIAIEPLFERWMARGCFMHSVNHPKGWAFADIGLAIGRKAGLLDEAARVDPDAIIDDLALHAAHPLLPPLARRLGLAGDTMFQRGHSGARRPLPMDAFLEAEYEAFAGATRQELEAVPFVSSLMAMLG